MTHPQIDTNNEELREKIRLIIIRPTSNDVSNNMLDEIIALITSRDRQIALAARIDESTPNAADEGTNQVNVHVPQKDHLSKSEYDRGWNECWDASWTARWKRVGELITLKAQEKS